MSNTLRQHDISDEVWGGLKFHFPGQKGQWNGVAKDNQFFINAVLWLLRAKAPWRDLLPAYA